MTRFTPVSLDVNPLNQSLQNGAALHLQGIFDLEPIGEVCLRFFLHIDSAPAGLSVDMNRWHVGSTQANQAFVADVTDYVTLEDNLLLLKLNQPGKIGSVWLEPIPCEEKL